MQVALARSQPDANINSKFVCGTSASAGAGRKRGDGKIVPFLAERQSEPSFGAQLLGSVEGGWKVQQTAESDRSDSL